MQRQRNRFHYAFRRLLAILVDVAVVFVRSLLIVVGKGGHLFSGLQFALLALHVPSGQRGQPERGWIIGKFAAYDFSFAEFSKDLVQRFCNLPPRSEIIDLTTNG